VLSRTGGLCYISTKPPIRLLDLHQKVSDGQPGKLTKSEQRRKLVIVAKKQVKNLERIIKFFDEDYTDLKDRKVLIVDDEADLASIRFVRKKDQTDVVEQGKIAEQMDAMRRLVAKVAYLQVTATPYSLYLQPDSYDGVDGGYVFKPKKPAFTELLPIHAGYVGGDDYFIGPIENDPRAFLFVEMPREEQDALRKEDQRRIREDRVLDSPNTAGMVRAIMTFVLASCLRRWQQSEAAEKKRKYAMAVHNDTQKAAHAWQDQVIEWIFAAATEAANSNPETLRPLFDRAFADLADRSRPTKVACLKLRRRSRCSSRRSRAATLFGRRSTPTTRSWRCSTRGASSGCGHRRWQGRSSAARRAALSCSAPGRHPFC
jgi:hypothetical protein